MTPFTKFLLWMTLVFAIVCGGMYALATGEISSGRQPLSIIKIHEQANQTLVEVGDYCSGTIIDVKNGLIVTAAHCTEKVHVKEVYVHKPSGQIIRQKVDRYDPIVVTLHKFDDEGNDIGHIRYTTRVLKAVYPQDVAILQNVSEEKFSSNVIVSVVPPKYGDRVFTVGNPMMFYGTIAEGRILKPKLTINAGSGPVTAIMFNSFMAPGSSGGGLFNEYGELIGITNWGLPGGPYLASPISNVIAVLNTLGIKEWHVVT